MQVYNTHTCETVAMLRGHSGKISAITWSADDTRVLSAGRDGAVYEWRVSDGKRDKEHVQKGCQYGAVAASPDNAVMLVAGSDCALKKVEDVAAGAQVAQEIEAGVILTHLHLSVVRCPACMWCGHA